LNICSQYNNILPVDEEGGGEGDDDLHDADDDGGDAGREGAAGGVEDNDRVEDDGVDARELLEQHQPEADGERLARDAVRQDRAQRLHLTRRLALLPLQGALHGAQLLRDVATGAAQLLQRALRLAFVASAKKD